MPDSQGSGTHCTLKLSHHLLTSDHLDFTNPAEPLETDCYEHHFLDFGPFQEKKALTRGRLINHFYLYLYLPSLGVERSLSLLNTSNWLLHHSLWCWSFCVWVVANCFVPSEKSDSAVNVTIACIHSSIYFLFIYFYYFGSVSEAIYCLLFQCVLQGQQNQPHQEVNITWLKFNSKVNLP